MAGGRRAVEAADRLTLEFQLETPQQVSVRLWASAAVAGFRLRAVKVQRAEAGLAALDWSGTHGRLNRWPLGRIRNVVVGNSGICTASCVHCPTNKPWLDVPRGEIMAPRIFDRLVEGLANCGLPITGAISFGLFGDPLWTATWPPASTPGVLGMHLAPVTGACTQDLAYDLILDWDGRLLTCCNDFPKRSDLGSLATATLPELLDDQRWRLLFRQLRNREWQRIEGCRTCLFDDPAATHAAVAVARAAAVA